MRRIAIIAAMLWTAVVLFVLACAQPLAQEPVHAEFRVFAGSEEITASTRLRIMPTGARDKAASIAEGKRLVADVPPGIYDVQALRVRSEGIVAIKWAERLVVMHYPDEAGHHLQVINFEPGYGALQVRAVKGPIADLELTVFPAGERAAVAASPVEGEDYRLFVLRAGRYDIKVRQPQVPEDIQAARWILDVEIPADRTRLKFVGP